MLKNLWNDDNGIVALEYLLVATLIGLSLVVGLHAVSTALNIELAELANAITTISQEYSYGGQAGCNSSVEGSRTLDAPTSQAYNALTAGSVQTIDEFCTP